MVFQAITTPDSLVSSLFGPFIGRSNDWGVYKDSRVAPRLHRMMPVGSNRQMLYLYGDPVENDNVEIHAWSFVWLSAVTM
jgi:hypothetical protein